MLILKSFDVVFFFLFLQYAWGEGENCEKKENRTRR